MKERESKGVGGKGERELLGKRRKVKEGKMWTLTKAWALYNELLVPSSPTP
jgi:hypothetical protein